MIWSSLGNMFLIKSLTLWSWASTRQASFLGGSNNKWSLRTWLLRLVLGTLVLLEWQLLMSWQQSTRRYVLSPVINDLVNSLRVPFSPLQEGFQVEHATWSCEGTGRAVEDWSEETLKGFHSEGVLDQWVDRHTGERDDDRVRVRLDWGLTNLTEHS